MLRTEENKSSRTFEHLEGILMLQRIRRFLGLSTRVTEEQLLIVNLVILVAGYMRKDAHWDKGVSCALCWNGEKMLRKIGFTLDTDGGIRSLKENQDE